MSAYPGFVALALFGVCEKTRSWKNEEMIINNCFFRGMRNGTFVEIGGFDGVQFSNTLMLDTCLSWQGILVEGSRTNYDQLLNNVELLGRRVTTHYGAVCSDVKRKVQFALGEHGTISGDWELMTESFRKQWHPKTAKKNLVEAPCKPMSAYMHGTPHVDFFSLDVEGAELEVLLTIDFTQVAIDMFMIELDEHNLDKNWKIRRLLKNLGYVECPKTVPSSGLFVHPRRTEWTSACRRSCKPVS